MNLPLCPKCGAVLPIKGNINYGRLMRDFRRTHKLSQEAMAKIIPMSRRGYQKLEYGKCSPTYTTIQRFEALQARYEENQNGFGE